MHEKGIGSQRLLAERAEVDANTLSNWFTGQSTPRTYELDRVARVLGVAVNDLWAAYGDATPQTSEEERVAELVRAAFERGFAAGFRAAREQRDEQ